MSQNSLVATGAKVVTINVFAEKERKYKLGLVLQMSFP